MYNVTNTGVSLRVVPTALGPVSIPRGVKRDGLHLLPGTAKFLRRAQEKGQKIEIEGTTDEARKVLETAQDVRRGFHMNGNRAMRPTIITPPAPAKDKDEVADDMRALLEQIETMKFPELRARAMILLGPRWPQNIGITARRQVKELLERALGVGSELIRSLSIGPLSITYGDQISASDFETSLYGQQFLAFRRRSKPAVLVV